MTTIVAARRFDVPAILRLAAEVEHWFGPMVNEPGFITAVESAIDDGRALIARRGEEPLGGLLFGGEYPVYRVGWLVVGEASRGTGVGRGLVAEAISRYVTAPAAVEVVTFGADHPASRVGGARVFYERLGFSPGPIEPNGPDGGGRQRYRMFVQGL